MNTKVIQRSALKGILEEHSRRGEKIVFTNGCFDILHVGHLRYLEQARALGDLLVVGINTDESVRRMKGPERPFVPEEERAEMLAGLECVDYVTFFSEPTPIETIEELKPHIHAKGGDYQISQIPEARVVESYGGRVAILPLVPGKSTTGLINHVRTLGKETSNVCRRAVGVIPARLASARLPGKPLLPIAGKPMIQWVYQQARKSKGLSQVIVATPDKEIARCVESFGGAAAMTSPNHRSGTDRVAEVARTVEADIFVNIQGDEPLLDPSAIDALVAAMSDPDVTMASLMAPALPGEETDPAVVKVVVDKKGFALYFSRSVIPYAQNPGAPPMKHIGVYAYRRNFLLTLGAKDPTPLETAESLEQLRVLETGGSIRMVQVQNSPAGVDTPEDLSRVREIMEKMHGVRS